ncbi:MAG: glycosyltransferase family 4 protein [bacterium]
MRVWLITSLRLRGDLKLRASGIQNVLTAAALAEQGHEVTLWVREMDSRGRCGLERFLGCRLPQRLRLFAGAVAGRSGEKQTPFSTWGRTLWNLVRARLVAGSPDLVVSRSPLLLAQLRISPFFTRRARLVLEFQYPEWALLWRSWRRKRPEASFGEARRELRRLVESERRWFNAADGVLYAASGHKPLLRRMGFQKPAAHFPSGCLTPDESPGDKAPDFDLGYVGSLAPENGLRTLFEALARLKDVSLIVVGDGSASYRASLETLIKRLEIQDRVHWVGRVPFCETRGFMQRCRVGVVPISARCGPEKRQWSSPLKLAEWMAAGVPVVASSVPSIRTQVEDRRNALLFKPDDAASLAETLRHLLGDPGLGASLAKKGLEQARQLSYPNRARLLTDFCERRLGEKAGS